MSFSQGYIKIMEFSKECHRSKVPAWLYHIGNHMVSNYPIISDALFYHLDKWYLSGFSTIKVLFFSLINIWGRYFGHCLCLVSHCRHQLSFRFWVVSCPVPSVLWWVREFVNLLFIQDVCFKFESVAVSTSQQK